MKKETKAQEMVKGLMAYIEQHPDERFHQSLRNYLGVNAIYSLKKGSPMDVELTEKSKKKCDLQDTFYAE